MVHRLGLASMASLAFFGEAWICTCLHFLRILSSITIDSFTSSAPPLCPLFTLITPFPLSKTIFLCLLSGAIVLFPVELLLSLTAVSMEQWANGIVGLLGPAFGCRRLGISSSSDDSI